MDDAPVPPIILLDTGGRPPEGPPKAGDLQTYESIAAVLSDIEAIDVRDGNLDAIDAEGRRIDLKAESYDGPVSWTLRGDGYPAELEELLRTAIRRIGPSRLGLIDADLGLDGLLRALWRFQHASKPYPGDIPAR